MKSKKGKKWEASAFFFCFKLFTKFQYRESKHMNALFFFIEEKKNASNNATHGTEL